MTTVSERLQALQQSISRRNEPDQMDEDTEKLYFTESQGLFYVEFFGLPGGEAYNECLQAICEPTVAPHLRSLAFRGPDEGANGTRNWDLTEIIASGSEFPALNSLFVEPTSPEHHNQSIIGSDYEEEGQIGRLLAKTPALKSLTVPSAPDAGFFQAGTRPLLILRIDSGYDHQDFIANMSRAACFPKLRMLDFGDYSQRYMENYQKQCTPFGDYELLFKSATFTGVGRLNLRNALLSADQLRQLHELRQDLQLFAIEAHGEYVR